MCRVCSQLVPPTVLSCVHRREEAAACLPHLLVSSRPPTDGAVFESLEESAQLYAAARGEAAGARDVHEREKMESLTLVEEPGPGSRVQHWGGLRVDSNPVLHDLSPSMVPTVRRFRADDQDYNFCCGGAGASAGRS